MMITTQIRVMDVLQQVCQSKAIFVPENLLIVLQLVETPNEQQMRNAMMETQILMTVVLVV